MARRNALPRCKKGRQPLSYSAPSPFERLHGPRHRRRLRREGSQPLQPRTPGRASRPGGFGRRAADGRSRQRQEPCGRVARNRRGRRRLRGPARRPDCQPATGRRALGRRGRGRNPRPAGRSAAPAHERAGTGPRPAERPRRRSRGAVLSPPGAESLPLATVEPAAEPSGAPKAKRRPPQALLRQYELIEKVRSYDPTADEGLLNRAYVYAMRMHGSQTRASGDPYFAHPIEVAGILTDYRLDTASIVTALLHDVIEDTPVSREDIEGLFGAEIAELVEGVTKLSRLELTAEHTRQAENLRKFILAISKDVRVLMVKLADRLHNMRTLRFIPEQARRERISRETIDIYAPLARSIGCHRICTELEELAFQHLNPIARDAIVRRLETLRGSQGEAVAVVSHEIAAKLEAEGLPARVYGREKHPYSIWRKLQRKSISFYQLSDIYAFRVILDTEEDCYRALGVNHSAWPCVPERFKDFISTPKRNNYRSIHTTVMGPRGMRIEMQIRTESMDRVAEDGVAAHWRYKDTSYGFDAEAMEAAGGRDPLANLRQLVQVLEHGGDAEDLVEHAKLEMFLDQ